MFSNHSSALEGQLYRFLLTSNILIIIKIVNLIINNKNNKIIIINKIKNNYSKIRDFLFIIQNFEMMDAEE